MGDINDINAAQSVKLIGSDATGVEQTPVKSYNQTREIATADVIDSIGLEGSLSIGTTAVEAKVGASALVGRKILTIHNNSNNTVFWGRTSSVTILTGTPLYKNQFVAFGHTENAPVYLIAGSAGNDIRVTESKGDGS